MLVIASGYRNILFLFYSGRKIVSFLVLQKTSKKHTFVVKLKKTTNSIIKRRNCYRKEYSNLLVDLF